MSIGGHRAERLAEEMLHEISLMLAGDLKDPRLAVPLTVNEVRLSADRRHARVYISVFSEPGDRSDILRGLQAAAGYVRHELVERLQLRRAPELDFVIDESEEYGEHIEDLIRKSKGGQTA